MRSATSKSMKQPAKSSTKMPIQIATTQKAVRVKKATGTKITKSYQTPKPIATTPSTPTASSATPKTNKQSQLINLLSQPQGSNLEDLVKTLGWQSHSIRGIISGVLRKKLGLNVVRQTLNGTCVYQILPKA